MNTLKSAAVIVVLLVVLYGVYVALNKPDFFSPPPRRPMSRRRWLSLGQPIPVRRTPLRRR